MKRSFRRSILSLLVCCTLTFTTGFAYAFSGTSPFSNTGTYGTVHNDRFKNYKIFNGVDVSYAQSGAKSNWVTARSKGVDFSIARVTWTGYGYEGSRNNDDNFKNHYTKGKSAGVLMGAYVFSQALTTAEAKAEAENAVKRLKELGIKPSDLALPVYMDYEFAGPSSGGKSNMGRLYYAKSKGKFTKKIATACAKTFCETIEKYGYDAGIYASLSFFDSYIDTSVTDKYDTWCAQYYKACQYSGNYSKWQYSSSAKISGINDANGNTRTVDVNYWYLNAARTSTSSSDIASCDISFAEGTDKYIYTGKDVCPDVVVKKASAKLQDEVAEATEESGATEESKASEVVEVAEESEITEETGNMAVTTSEQDGEDSDTETTNEIENEQAEDAADNVAELNESTTTLVKGKDYAVFYLKNIKKGTAYVYIKGLGDYTGYKLIPFTIATMLPVTTDTEEFELATCDLAASAGYVVGTSDVKGVISGTTAAGLKKALVIDSAHTIKIVKSTGDAVSDSSAVTTGCYVTVYNSSGVNVGSRKIRVTGTASATPSTKKYTYNGKAKNPKVTAKFGEYTVLSGANKGNSYATVKYSASTSKLPGTYYITVKGSGMFAGVTAKAKYTISVKSTSLTKLKNKKKYFIAYWGKQSSTYVTGYQIQYSRYTNMSNDLIKTYSSYKTKSGKIKVNYPGNKYYARIRTYKKIGNKKYYSSWSPKLSVVVK